MGWFSSWFSDWWSSWFGDTGGLFPQRLRNPRALGAAGGPRSARALGSGPRNLRSV